MWQRVTTDTFELFGNQYYLTVDNYLVYFVFTKLDHSSSQSLIAYLKYSFTTHAISDVIESSSGPQ